MDDPLLVHVLHRRADLTEERQPLREAEPVASPVSAEVFSQEGSLARLTGSARPYRRLGRVETGDQIQAWGKAFRSRAFPFSENLQLSIFKSSKYFKARRWGIAVSVSPVTRR
jgi:hypothetical protein